MVNYKYTIILFWSVEDKYVIAEIPELAGWMADGTTHKEALVNAETAVDQLLQTAKELGREILLPKGKLMFA